MSVRPALLALVLLAALFASPPVASADAGRPWFGVMMGTSTSEDGVLVKHVVRGSPADKSGLRDGDRILRIEATSVHSAVEVVRVVADRAAGESLTITLAREGKPITSKVTLGTMPPSDELLRMDRVGTFAPAFAKLEAVEGSLPASIASLRGRVVVIDFWATWCAPCRATAPQLAAWQSRYGAQGLSIIGISTEESAKIASFSRQHAATYPLASDAEQATSSAYGISGLPTLFVVDKRGVIRSVVVGFEPGRFARLEAEIQAMLAEPAPSD